MRNLIVSGAQLKGFKINSKGEGMLSILKTTYRNKQQKGNFIGVILTGDKLEAYQSAPIAAGSGINVYGGNVTISQIADKDGNVKPSIIVRNPDVEPATAAGSGLFHLILTNVRITEDVQEKENCVNCKAVMNYTENGQEKAMWLYLTFWGDRASRAKAMKLKKGSAIDIDTELDVSIYSDGGNSYLNIYLTIDDIAYTAIDKTKKDENTSSAAPAPTPAPAAPKAATTPDSFEGPSPDEISQAAPAVAPDSQPSDDGVQDSLLEDDENVFF